jgi:hypothetical protein
MPANDLTKRRVWVRCGGRCVICNRYLLEEHLESGDAVRSVGEVAHVAGESPKGPRGISRYIGLRQRNDEANLILLCPTDHRSADKRRLADPIYTEEYLFRLKATHEAFVRFATGLRDTNKTTIVRAFGDVRGAPGNVPVADAAMAVMRHSLRTPRYLPDPRGIGQEVDLHRVPQPGDPTYWSTAILQIDDDLERVHKAITAGDTDHVSLFAITLVPLLVAIGNRLDDTVPLDVYEKHRTTQSWSWDPDAPPVAFVASVPDGVPDDAVEACLIINASGTIHSHELPEHLRELAVFTVEPGGGVPPSTSTFDNHETLVSFTSALVDLFSTIEATSKTIRRLHVFAAVPVSAAVTLGRTLAVDNAAPALAMYHRTGNAYVHVFDLPYQPPALDNATIKDTP